MNEDETQSPFNNLRNATNELVDAAVKVADAAVVMPDTAVDEYAKLRGVPRNSHQHPIRSLVDLISTTTNEKARGR